MARIEQFFDTLYLRYDERYVYAAPDLKHTTSRIEWLSDSPALATADAAERLQDFTIRLHG